MAWVAWCVAGWRAVELLRGAVEVQLGTGVFPTVALACTRTGVSTALGARGLTALTAVSEGREPPAQESIVCGDSLGGVENVCQWVLVWWGQF